MDDDPDVQRPMAKILVKLGFSVSSLSIQVISLAETRIVKPNKNINPTIKIIFFINNRQK